MPKSDKLKAEIAARKATEEELAAKARDYIAHPLPDAAPSRLSPGDSASLAVFRDQHGVVYLRVATGRKGTSQYVVNKGFAVEEVTIGRASEISMGFEQVANASLVATAKRLLLPLNDSVIISKRAQERLTAICNNKEIEMAEVAEATAKTKKFTKVTAPTEKKKGKNTSKGIGYVPNYTVTLKKQPKEDTKLPKQALAILGVLQKKGGSLEYTKLIAALEGQIETAQPVAKIWSFYRNRLETEGFVVVKEAPAAA